MGSRKAAALRSDGGWLRADRVSITPRQLIVSPGSPDPRAIPLDEVDAVRFYHRGRGAVEGAGIGAAVAVAVGALVALSDDGDTYFDSEGGAFLFTSSLTALVSIPAGALLGALIGHRTTVEIVPGGSR